MTYARTLALRAIQDDLLAAAQKLKGLSDSNPARPNNAVDFAFGQINSAVRYIEVAILRRGGAAHNPPVIG